MLKISFIKKLFIFCLLHGFLLASSSSQSTTVINTELVTVNNTTTITIETDQALKYTVLTLQNPNRVVLDVKNTAINDALKMLSLKLYANNLQISQVRIAKFQLNVTRLVFDLKAEANVDVSVLTPSTQLKHRLILTIGDVIEKDNVNRFNDANTVKQPATNAPLRTDKETTTKTIIINAPATHNGAKIVLDQIPVFDNEENAEDVDELTNPLLQNEQ